MTAFAELCYLSFMRTGTAAGPLVDFLRLSSKDPAANNLYEQIRLGSRDSKVPITCKHCGKDFILVDLPGYRSARRGEND